MPERTIADEEVLYRRIPPGNDWFEPPDRISSFNFKLRPDELGISVYRAIAVSAAEVLSKSEAKPGSRIAQASVGPIRAACDGKGEPLHLDVVPVNEENDPGHAEIRGPVPGLVSSSASKALKKLFKLCQTTAQGP